MRRLALLVALIVLVPSVTRAADLYVNNTGTPACSDATVKASNSAGSPWCTLGRAVWGNATRATPSTAQAAAAGDTVHVTPGTYDTTQDGGGGLFPTYNPANAGTLGNPIVFQCSTVRQCFLTYSGGAEGAVIGSNDKDYITWKGFVVDNSASSWPGDDGAVIDGAVGVRIEYCDIYSDPANPGSDNHVGVFVQATTGVYLGNNRFSGWKTTINQINGTGIMTYKSSDLIIEHNEMTNNGSGIQIKATAYDGDFSYLGPIDIRYNLINDVDTQGIIIHRSPHTEAEPARIYQNIVKNSPQCFAFRMFGGESGLTNPKNSWFINNTCYNVTSSGLAIDATSTIPSDSNNKAQNNIFHTGTDGGWDNGSGDEANFSTTTYTINRNVWYNFTGTFYEGNTNKSYANYRTDFGFDADSVTTDPLFVNAGTGDFHLQGGSPALTLGRAVDNIGAATGTTIPAGAYITGNETIGVGSSSSSTVYRFRFRAALPSSERLFARQ